MDNIDPLSNLIVSDTKEINRQKLAELLGPYLFFDQASKKMDFKDKFRAISTNSDKLELILVGDKARVLLFSDGPIEGMSQKDILSLEVMPEGSVKSTLKSLADSKKVLKNSEGKYYIPNYRLTEIFSKFK